MDGCQLVAVRAERCKGDYAKMPYFFVNLT